MIPLSPDFLQGVGGAVVYGLGGVIVWTLIKALIPYKTTTTRGDKPVYAWDFLVVSGLRFGRGDARITRRWREAFIIDFGIASFWHRPWMTLVLNKEAIFLWIEVHREHPWCIGTQAPECRGDVVIEAWGPAWLHLWRVRKAITETEEGEE